MKYKGDKYLKAYKHYRDKLDDRVHTNAVRIAELERNLEWLVGKMLAELEELKK